jgi:crotonobetainyl-CoA:carnitine CoA-transferase CaiB-like acyl-CoA transferase
MCQTPKFWDRFCELAGAPHLKADARFADIPSRRANLAALSEAVDAVTSTRATDEWLGILGGEVPFAPVRDVAEALSNPFVAEVGMRDVVEHPDRDRGLHMLASPVKIDGKRAPGVRAPKLGEQTDKVLGE